MAECTCYPVPFEECTTYGSAVEPGSAFEPNPDCPEHFPSGGIETENKTVSEIAKSLDFRQRKALRRIGRGQSVNRSMLDDPLVKAFYVRNIPSPPTGDDLNIVTWSDWESDLRFSLTHPRITLFGKEVLEELEKHSPQAD